LLKNKENFMNKYVLTLLTLVTAGSTMRSSQWSPVINDDVDSWSNYSQTSNHFQLEENNPIDDAIRLNDMAALKQAMQQGADVELADTPLINATSLWRSHEMIQYLIDHGAHLEEQDFAKFTPLMVAAQMGNE
jgi:ankyrin repeat protein